MKTNLSFIILCLIGLSFNVKGQNLYVPNGTAGISGSTTSNIGIGTSAPAYTFHIAKSDNSATGTRIQVSNLNTLNTGNNFSALTLSNHDLSCVTQFYLDINGTGPLNRKGSYLGTFQSYDLGLFTSNIERLTVSKSGNIGIGTIDPTDKLTVFNGNFFVRRADAYDAMVGSVHNAKTGYGFARFFSQVFEGVNGHPYMEYRIRNTADNNIVTSWSHGINNLDNDKFVISCATGQASSPSEGSKHFIMTTAGNVGIGIISPTQKLDVAGTIKATSFIGDGSQLTGIAGTSQWTTSGSNIFYNTGNIGIGVTNPQNKLDVNGTIHAREVKVDLTGWSDFVFHPSYQLKSLTEVEKFIQTNGHLEDIPSAAQVEKEGVNVGEMQAKLLQKIEELTLYIIEQQKILEKQNQKIEQLEQSLQNKNLQ